MPVPKNNNQVPGSEGLREDVSNQASQPNFLEVRRPSELTETTIDHNSEVTDQKQREKLDWFSTWEED